MSSDIQHITHRKDAMHGVSPSHQSNKISSVTKCPILINNHRKDAMHGVSTGVITNINIITKHIMKTKITYLMTMFLMGTISFSNAQEPKKMRVVIDRDENGKNVLIDTTFGSRAEMEAWMKAEVHELPVMARMPVMPEIPEMPDLDEIEITVDGANLTEEDKATIRKELESAKKEMEKARREMKHNRKELNKAGQELHEMHLEVERDGFEHRMIYMHDDEKDGKPCNATTQVMVFPERKDGKDPELKICIVRMCCDSSDECNHKKIKTAWKERAETAPEAEPVIEQSKGPAAPAATPDYTETTADHRLVAADFRLFPNPTQGKVRVTFNTGKTGTIEARILDASGKVVVEEQVQSTDGSFDREYTIEGSARGTYLLQLRQGDYWRHEKIVLK
jgi:hypothetical protein